MTAETRWSREPEGGTSVAVVFHSASGHVRKLAHRVVAAAGERRDVTVELHVDALVAAVADIEVIDQQLWDALAPVDAIVVGCPTFMGGPSSVYEAFAEASLPICAGRRGSDTVAAGFTHSQAMSGDKLNTPGVLQPPAAQHGMLWTNVDLLPGWCGEGSSTDDLNRLGGWLGVMSRSNGGSDPQVNPRESDLPTAEHLGARVADVARALRSGKALLDHYDWRHVVSSGAHTATREECDMKPNEKLVLDMIHAVEERDAERILEIYDPDVEFHWPPSLPGYGGTYRGREVIDMNTAFTDAWDPLQPTEEARRIHPRVVASNDEEVVVLYHQRGTDQSGRSCDSEVLAIYRVENGRVTRLQMFYFEPERIADFLTAAAHKSVG